MRRSWASGVAALVLSLALVGCGGDDDTGADAAPSEPASEPAPSESGGSEPSPSPDDQGPESTAPNETGPPSEREVRLALLTLDDVPAGWVEQPSEDSTDDELCDFDPAGILGVDEDELPQADVVLSADQTTGPTVAEALAVLPPGRGADLIAELRKALDDCEGERVGGIPLAVSTLDFPNLADDSAAYLLQLGDGGGGYSFPLVYAVHGDLVIGLWAYDTTGDPADLLRRYAPLAVDKAIRGLE